MENTKRHVYLAYFIAILSFVLSIFYASWGLPGLWHPDEMDIVETSLKMAEKGSFNPHFFAYPSLHIYLIFFFNVLPVKFLSQFSYFESLVDFIGIAQDASSQTYLLSRVMSAFMGATTVFIVYKIAVKIFDVKTGLFSALFLAICAGFINLSHFATVDIPLCFWGIASFYMFLRVLEKKSAVNIMLAGFILGLATSTKYNAILMIIPLLASTLMGSTTSSGREVLTGFIKNSLLIILAVTTGFALGSPYAIIDFPAFIAEFIELNFYQGTYAGVTGSGFSRLSFIAHIINLIDILGGFIFALSAIGFFYMAFLAKTQKKSAIYLLLLTVLTIYFKMGSMTFHPPRYILPIVPFLVIGAGKLTVDLFLLKKPKIFNLILSAMFALGVIYTLTISILGILQIKNDDRNLAFDWITKQVKATESVEMTPIYGINIPPNYHQFKTMPAYHQKETFERMFYNKEYQKIKTILPWANWSEMTQVTIQPEPENVSLASLLERKPAYLILSERWFQRFLNTDVKADKFFPKQHQLYTALLNEETPYKIMVDFRKPKKLPLTPKWDFINSGIVILAYQR